MEKIKFIDDSNDKKELSNVEIRTEKESIFDVLIINEIISGFSDDLSESGFDEVEVQEFENEIQNLHENEIKSILSLPKELRLKNFSKYYEIIKSKKKTMHELVLEIAKKSTENGFTLGYHVSNNEILPINNEWVIDGKEFDDRDERTMAYYSMDYKNIFRTHRFKWLYIIRADIGESTSHKRDTSNNWGRASTLPIVHKVNLMDVDEQVEKIFSQKKQQDPDIKKSAA